MPLFLRYQFNFKVICHTTTLIECNIIERRERICNHVFKSISFSLVRGQSHRYLKKWHKITPFNTELVLNFNDLNKFRIARGKNFSG